MRQKRVIMKWRNHLYVGKQVKKHESRIRKRLESGKTDIGHYLITLSVNQNDQLDIIDTAFLMSEEKRKELPEIVGIAGSEEEALNLVRQMVEDCLSDTGDADLRSFFENDSLN